MAAFLLAVLGWGWWASRPSSSEPRTVTIVCALNPSQPADSEWLSEAVAKLLARQLAAGDALRVVSAPVDADFLVHGTFQITDEVGGQKLQLTLSTRDISEDRALEPISLTRPVAELFDLMFTAGMSLRDLLGVGKIGFIDQRAIRAANPSSARALRFYLDGLDKLRRSDLLGARDALSKAIEADPEYGLAHAALSRAWSALGDDHQAQTSAARSLELASGLPLADRLRLEGRHFETMAEWPRATHAYERLRRLVPDDVDCGLRLAEAQIMSGKGQDALDTIAELRARSVFAQGDPRIDLAEAKAAKSLSNYHLQMTAAKNAVEKGTARSAPIQVANARRSQGEAHYRLQEYELARRAFEESRQLFEEAGDRRRVAEVLSWLADIRYSQGDPAAAVNLYHEARRIHHDTGNRKGVLETENSLGYQLYLQGHLTSARTLLKEAVDIGKEIGDRNSEANSLDSLVEVVFRLGELAAAEELALRERTIYRELGNQLGSVWSHYHLGRIALANGDVPKAKELYDRALAIGDRIGDRYWKALILDGLSRVLLAADERENARRMSDDARTIRHDLGGEETLAGSQVTSALVLLELDRPSEAEALARPAIGVYRAKARPDDQAEAMTVLARALIAQGRLAEAQAALAAAEHRARDTQNPTVRLSSAITGAELLAAAGKNAEATKMLEAVVTEAHDLGLIMLELEARLTLGRTEVTAGLGGGHRRLQELSTRAGELRCGLIARKATAALSGRS